MQNRLIAGKKAAAVDPVEPQKILEAAKREGVIVDTILTTHKHWDHAGGNKEFAKLMPGIPVLGGVNDHVEACTRTVSDGEEFDYGNIHIKCLETPFHTLGHITYVCESGGKRLAFTGDTLFIAGCGRMFEGKPEQMFNSLIGKLAKLTPDTEVWCGHEYTVQNLKFAAHADKNNEAVKQKLAWAEEQRSKGLPTIPSSIGEELQINPFLRPDDPDLKAFTEKSDPVDVLFALRKAKDSFKG